MHVSIILLLVTIDIVMEKKTKGLTVLGLLAVLGAGTYSISTGDINFGTMWEVGQIGDNNYINNVIYENFGINVDKFREQCKAGMYTDPTSLGYCELVK
jgi:hypothetical protein